MREFIVLEPPPPPPPHDHYTGVQKKFGAMSPDSKILHEEIQRLFTKQNTKPEQRFIEADLNFN